MLKPGTPVVFRKSKHSTHPGPRARDVHPARFGDDYRYFVDKLWVVAETRGDQIVVRTRRGKTHILDARDRNLRPARWWERLLFGHRFPKLLESEAAGKGS